MWARINRLLDRTVPSFTFWLIVIGGISVVASLVACGGAYQIAWKENDRIQAALESRMDGFVQDRVNIKARLDKLEFTPAPTRPWWKRR